MDGCATVDIRSMTDNTEPAATVPPPQVKRPTATYTTQDTHREARNTGASGNMQHGANRATQNNQNTVSSSNMADEPNMHSAVSTHTDTGQRWSTRTSTAARTSQHTRTAAQAKEMLSK